MTKRALLLGSPADGLRGVEPSVAAMSTFLTDLGFACTTLVGEAATRDEIRIALEALVLTTRKDDAVVLYYAGHGELFLARKRSAPGDVRERTHGVLVTMDMLNSDAEHFLGVLGLELSAWLHRLEQRTANITAILDCCHADAVLAPLTPAEFAAAKLQIPRLKDAVGRALEKTTRSTHTPGSVRLLASTAGIEAYLDPDGDLLLFTDRLLKTLRDPAIRDGWTWDQILHKVRDEVQRANDAQRPSVAGARHRRPFTTDDQPQPAESFHVETVDGALRIPQGALRGLRPGDLFDLRDYASGASHGHAWVHALLDVDAVLASASPADLQWCWACRVGHASALTIDADDDPGLLADLRAGRFHPAARGTATTARIRVLDRQRHVSLVDAAGERVVAVLTAAPSALHATLRRIEQWDALQRWISGHRGRLEDAYQLTWSRDDGPPQPGLTRDDEIRASLGVVVHNPGIRHSQLFVRVLRVAPDLTIDKFAGSRPAWHVTSERTEVERYSLRELPRGAPHGILVAIADGPFELDVLVTAARDRITRGGQKRGLEHLHALGRARVVELFYREFSRTPAAS